MMISFSRSCLMLTMVRLMVVSVAAADDDLELFEERQALYALKGAITHDPTGSIWGTWNGKEPCGNAAQPPWEGVRCSRRGRGSVPRVWGLSLNSMELEGTIPMELGRLTNLLSIDATLCHFQGTLPPEITALPKLQYLIMSGNRLSGELPNNWTGLADLEAMNLAGNQGLQGTIPRSMGDLKSVRKIVVSGTALTGPIPTELGQLTLLTSLELGHNRLTSTLPSELSALTKLIKLSLPGNGLTGSIPEGLSALTNLEEMDLSVQRTGGGGGLLGTVPDGVGNLSELKILDLHYNNLSGAIPTNLGTLASLQVLNLASNGFSGSVPAELNRLSNLAALYLSQNNLSGSVEFLTKKESKLDALMYAYLGENPFFCGDIPVNQSLAPWVKGTRIGIQSISTTTDGVSPDTWGQCPAEPPPVPLPLPATRAVQLSSSSSPSNADQRALDFDLDTSDERTAAQGQGSSLRRSRKSQAGLVYTSNTDSQAGHMASNRNPTEKVDYVRSQGAELGLKDKVNYMEQAHPQEGSEAFDTTQTPTAGGPNMDNSELRALQSRPQENSTAPRASALGRRSPEYSIPTVHVKRDRSADLLERRGR